MNPNEFVYYFEPQEIEPLIDDRPDLSNDKHLSTSRGAAEVPERVRVGESSESIEQLPGDKPPSAWPSGRTGHSEQTRLDSHKDPPTESEGADHDDTFDNVKLPRAEDSNDADSDRRRAHVIDHPARVAGTTSRPSQAYNGRLASPSPDAEYQDPVVWKIARSPSWGQRDLISVHVLGQFAFCNRAGIYSAENGEECDPDELEPRLDFLPNFELERIEEQLSNLVHGLCGLLILILAFASAMVGGVVVHSRQVFYPALVGCTVCLICLPRNIQSTWILMRRRTAARRALAREPEPTIQRIQPVNWWSMLKAGFEPVSYRRQIRHPVLPLEGNPWRILERGSVRIPVALSGGDKLGDATHSIYPKHELRLGAYALLLEATEHVKVPYGLIFPANSHLGLAVPIGDSLRDRVQAAVSHTRDLLSRSQAGESDPRPPEDKQRCTTCRLGAPQPISDSEIVKTRQSGKRLLILEDRMDRRFHCPCGDRFGSAPPHGRIIKLGLRSSLG